MKKLVLIVLLFLPSIITSACDVCKKQQPKILSGIAHGAGPDSRWDYLIISITGVAVLLTFFYSIKFLLKPGEKSKTHIKQFIFNAE